MVNHINLDHMHIVIIDNIYEYISLFATHLAKGCVPSIFQLLRVGGCGAASGGACGGGHAEESIEGWICSAVGGGWSGSTHPSSQKMRALSVLGWGGSGALSLLEPLQVSVGYYPLIMRPPLLYTVIGRGPMWQSNSPKIKSMTPHNHSRIQRREILFGWAGKKRRRVGGWSGSNKKNNGHNKGDTNNSNGSSSQIPGTTGVIDTIQNDIISKTNNSNNLHGFCPKRFFNPWHELARVVPTEEMLHDKVDSTTRTFGIVGALMGSLAAALLTFNPLVDGYDTNREPVGGRLSMDPTLSIAIMTVHAAIMMMACSNHSLRCH